MPKVLIFNDIWIFIIYPTDMYENRMHVHVGKKAMTTLCKIWLEPNVEIANAGELTTKQQNEVLEIAQTYRNQLIQQWQNFVKGKTIEILKVK